MVEREKNSQRPPPLSIYSKLYLKEDKTRKQ